MSNSTPPDDYQNYNPLYPFKLLLRAVFARDSIKRRSILNRQKDYLSLNNNPGLMAFHAEIVALLEKANEAWESYDYGQSYFYQGCKALNITGLRDTEARIAATGLSDIVKNKRIFEVGTNAGFFSIELARFAGSVTGLEINPHLVEISNAACRYLDRNNVDIVATSFEDYAAQETYEVFLSLANHSTYDGLTGHALSEYFAKCRDMTAKDGVFVFESHPEGFEPGGIEKTLDTLSRFFFIQSRNVPEYGTPLDRNRTVVIARPV